MKWPHTDSRDRKQTKRAHNAARLNQDVAQRQENLSRKLAKANPGNADAQKYLKADTAANAKAKRRVLQAEKERRATKLTGG